MSFMALHARVLDRRVEAKARIGGSLLVPDSARGKSRGGEVIAVGEGVQLFTFQTGMFT